MDFISWVQRRLIAHGFNPGDVDGEWGRHTLGATIAFQTACGLPAQGVLNTATVSALRVDPMGLSPTRADGDEPPTRDLLDRFLWMTLALKKRGLHEGRDNFELRAFLKSDGPTLGDPAKLPWCGDFVETCLAVTLPTTVLPTNPYLARNWLKFGRTVDPCFAAVMVFWRGKRSGTSGHVGFYYSEDNEFYHILGGNQKDSVSVTKVRRDRLLGARMPTVGGPYPKRVVREAADWEISENEF